MYQQKYLKYESKYINLKLQKDNQNQIGGKDNVPSEDDILNGSNKDNYQFCIQGNGKFICKSWASGFLL